MGSSPASTFSAFEPPRRDSSSDSRLAWIAALSLALLLHLLASFSLPRALRHARPVSVSVQPMSSSELDRLKEKWRRLEDSRNQQLLLEPAKDKAAQPPEDSKFLSNRNIRVDRQMRARDSSVLPRPGAPGIPQSDLQQTKPSPEQSAEKALRQATPGKRLDLGKLGVPLGMTDARTRDVRERPAKSREMERRDQRRGGQLGASQSVLDEDIPEGGQNMLNARESVFYSFYSRIYESIAPVWESHAREVPRQRRLIPGDYVTIVEVEIDSPGALVDVRVLQSSGVPAFDRAVIESWKKLARFPNPPQGLLDSRGHVSMKWSFQFRLTPGAALQAGAPQRAF